MRLSKSRIALAAVLISVVAAAHAADCHSNYVALSQHAFQPNHPAGPVAWNGSVLAVARTTANVPVGVSIHDLNLTVLTPETAVTTSPYGRSLKLLSNGNKFALVFFTSANTIAFQEVSATGTRIGDERRIGGTHGASPQQELDAAYNSVTGQWEIVYSVPFGGDTGIWVTTINATSGTVNDIHLQTFATPDANPRIATSSTGATAISWYRPNPDRTLFITFYDTALNFSTNTAIISTVAQLPIIGGSASNFTLIYQAPISGGTELRWVRFTTTGAITNADTRMMLGTGVDIAPVSLMWNPTLSEWAFTYIDAPLGAETFPGDYRIRRFTPAALISDTLFTPDPLRSAVAGRDPIVWSGSAYFGAISKFFSQSEGSDSYVVKHCPLTASIKAANPTPTVLQPFAFSAFPSGGAPPYTYSWDFGDFSEKRPEQSIGHGYTRTGTYTVTLTVQDSLGDRTVQTTTVTVVDTVRRRPVRH